MVRIAHAWAVRCFGSEHVGDPQVRALRLVEEAVELAQAVGAPQSKILDVVSAVYAKPAGEPFQEVGGVSMTLAIFCQSLGINPDRAFERELTRCLSKTPEHFRAREQTKIDGGLS